MELQCYLIEHSEYGIGLLQGLWPHKVILKNVSIHLCTERFEPEAPVFERSTVIGEFVC
jgi:hypothetical protein